jgi:hypothetical protein
MGSSCFSFGWSWVQITTQEINILCGGTGSFPGQAIWVLWCTEWHWYVFFLQTLRSFLVSIIPPVIHTHRRDVT